MVTPLQPLGPIRVSHARWNYSRYVYLTAAFFAEGYFLSIPSAVERAGNFQSLAKALPLSSILTETGALIANSCIQFDKVVFLTCI